MNRKAKWNMCTALLGGLSMAFAAIFICIAATKKQTNVLHAKRSFAGQFIPKIPVAGGCTSQLNTSAKRRSTPSAGENKQLNQNSLCPKTQVINLSSRDKIGPMVVIMAAASSYLVYNVVKPRKKDDPDKVNLSSNSALIKPPIKVKYSSAKPINDPSGDSEDNLQAACPSLLSPTSVQCIEVVYHYKISCCQRVSYPTYWVYYEYCTTFTRYQYIGERHTAYLDVFKKQWNFVMVAQKVPIYCANSSLIQRKRRSSLKSILTVFANINLNPRNLVLSNGLNNEVVQPELNVEENENVSRGRVESSLEQPVIPYLSLNNEVSSKPFSWKAYMQYKAQQNTAKTWVSFVKQKGKEAASLEGIRKQYLQGIVALMKQLYKTSSIERGFYSIKDDQKVLFDYLFTYVVSFAPKGDYIKRNMIAYERSDFWSSLYKDKVNKQYGIDMRSENHTRYNKTEALLPNECHHLLFGEISLDDKTAKKTFIRFQKKPMGTKLEGMLRFFTYRSSKMEDMPQAKRERDVNAMRSIFEKIYKKIEKKAGKVSKWPVHEIHGYLQKKYASCRTMKFDYNDFYKKAHKLGGDPAIRTEREEVLSMQEKGNEMVFVYEKLSFENWKKKYKVYLPK